MKISKRNKNYVQWRDKKKHRVGITIDGESPQEMDHYQYLGRILIPGYDIAKEIGQQYFL